MRTSFHHQPEAQHPNFRYQQAGRPITPSLDRFSDSSRTFPEVRVVPNSDISHLHSMTNCGVAANRWSRDAGDLKRRPRQLGAGPTFPRTKLPGLMRLNLGLHARYIYRIRRQKRAMLIWIKYFSNLSRNSRKALCSGWDWHQSEGMAKLTTSLNAFFRRGRVPSGSKYHPLPDFHMFEDGPVILRNSP